MPLHFNKANQPVLLDLAAEATGSLGWRKDAIAVAVYDRGTPDDLRAIVVFQNIDAYGAEMHFAMMGDHRLGLEVAKGVATIATHPRMMNLPAVWAHISEDNIPAQIAALKSGFQFEYRKRGGAAGRKDAIVMSIRRVEAPANVAPVKPTENPPEPGDDSRGE